MSTALPSQRQLFFVWAPDKNDEEAFSRRLLVRESHLATAKEHISNGFIRIAGAVTTPESIAIPDAPKKMIGSSFICEAKSIEEVRKNIEEDVYYKSGVWDVEKIVILPYFPLTPIP